MSADSVAVDSRPQVLIMNISVINKRYRQLSNRCAICFDLFFVLIFVLLLCVFFKFVLQYSASDRVIILCVL